MKELQPAQPQLRAAAEAWSDALRACMQPTQHSLCRVRHGTRRHGKHCWAPSLLAAPPPRHAPQAAHAHFSALMLSISGSCAMGSGGYQAISFCPTSAFRSTLRPDRSPLPARWRQGWERGVHAQVGGQGEEESAAAAALLERSTTSVARARGSCPTRASPALQCNRRGNGFAAQPRQRLLRKNYSQAPPAGLPHPLPKPQPNPPMCVPKMRDRICSKLSSSAAAGAAAAAGVGAAAAAYCRQPAAAAAGPLPAAWATAGARQRRELRVEAAPSCCAAQGTSSSVSRCNPLSILLRLPKERRSAMAGAVCSRRADRAGRGAR